VLAALEQRDRTGEGVLVESAMVETALNVAAEQVVEYTAYGKVLERDGNRSPDAAPQGIYACRSGAEDYVAVSIGSDEQWGRLCDAIDAADLARDEALASLAGRRAAHDALDERIAAWVAEQGDVAAAVDHLVAHGVPAAPLVDTRSTASHPHLVARGFYEELDHPVVGRHPHPSAPFRFASVDRWLRRPAPTLGEHNREVVAELGLSDDEVAALERAQVIGTRPLGA
jgi:crotonobetainyl-CoA:carnitine CoA-transferase CaiB-like acyl-CoA transferase